VIRTAVHRMTRLMESTLSVARSDEVGLSISVEDCRLHDVIASAVKYQQQISKNCDVSYDLDGLPDVVVCDPSSMEQVFTNLLSNAVKYSPDRPEIEIRGWQQGNQVYVAVKDHGLGISEADLPSMFDRFFRAKSSVGIEGTGIGLNIVKHLVELHQGEINVESEEGVGSTFTVCLPCSGPKKTEQLALGVA